MEYIYILDKDASVAEIGSQLRLLDGVAWRIDNGNLRVEVPDNLYTTYESRIFDAVASGIWATNGHQHDDEKANESSVLCGALQTRLLNRYLPSMFESMTSGIVIEVESIDSSLSMLRMRGPKRAAKEIDAVSAWIMSKCAVGVPAES